MKKFYKRKLSIGHRPSAASIISRAVFCGNGDSKSL